MRNKTSVDLTVDLVGRIDPAHKGALLNYVYTVGENKPGSNLFPYPG